MESLINHMQQMRVSSTFGITDTGEALPQKWFYISEEERKRDCFVFSDAEHKRFEDMWDSHREYSKLCFEEDPKSKDFNGLLMRFMRYLAWMSIHKHVSIRVENHHCTGTQWLQSVQLTPKDLSASME